LLYLGEPDGFAFFICLMYLLKKTKSHRVNAQVSLYNHHTIFKVYGVAR
jgi:hypothetical protein